MYECERCGKKCFMRTEHLLHISVCNRYQCLISDETEDVIDDAVDSGGSHEFNNGSENIVLDQRKTGSFSICLSPLTNEQRGIAEYAESMLLPETNQSPVIVEQPVAGESENTFHDLSSQKTSDMKLSRQQATKKKLKDIQKLIETWKQQKKQAVIEGKCNKARRLSKKIKKMQSLQTLPEKTRDCNPHLQEPLEGLENSYFSNMDEPCPVEQPPIAEQFDLSTEENNNKRERSGGRKKNFCKYCKRMKTNYSRHVDKIHPETEEGQELVKISSDPSLTSKQKKKLKMQATERLKKLSNSEYNSKLISESLNSNSEDYLKNFVPVRSKNKKKKENHSFHNYIQCSHCHGLCIRRKFSLHLKNCSQNEFISRTPTKSPSKRINAIKEHSLILTPLDPILEEAFKDEILNHMIDDDISRAVRSDPLILKMGQEFHKSRRHTSERSYCSREMRDLGKLLIQLRKQNPEIHSLEDSFKPAYFGDIVKAVEHLNGYNSTTGKVRVVGLAYRLLQPLQQCLLLLRKQRIEEMSREGNDRTRLEMVNDFIQLIKDHWSNQVGRQSTKSMKEQKSLKNPKMAWEEDIKVLCKYLISQYDSDIALLNENPTTTVYDELLDVLLSHIMCLARRRPVDLTRGTVEHLNLIDKNDDLLNMLQKNAWEGLDPKDIDNCKNFHIFFVPGKKYEKVPIVLTKKMKEALDTLVRNRSAVGITSNLLFIHSKNKIVDATQSLERMKKRVQLKNPRDLTGNGLRHQAATFSKFHSSDPLYQDHLATTLGHTLFIHKKNYDLPTTIAQKTVVCPVLHRMTESEVCNSSDVQEDVFPGVELNSNLDITPQKKRQKWSTPEKKEIYKMFGDDILKGICPKRKDILDLKNKFQDLFGNRTDASMVTFIHNAAKRKMLGVSPEVKRFKKSAD